MHVTITIRVRGEDVMMQCLAGQMMGMMLTRWWTIRADRRDYSDGLVNGVRGTSDLKMMR